MSRSALLLFSFCLLLLSGFTACKPKQAVVNNTTTTPPPPPPPPPPVEPEDIEEEDATPFVPSVTISEGFDKENLGAPVTIVSHAIEDRYLTLTVSFSGGCATHSFDLSTDMEFMSSSPPAATVYLLHHDNEDACEAYLTETLMFDLSALRNQEFTEMTITLFGYDTPITYEY